MHLKVVIVSEATAVARPGTAEPPIMNPNNRKSSPFAAMFKGVGRLRSFAEGGGCTGLTEADAVRCLTDVVKGSNEDDCDGGDARVASFDIVPVRRTSTIRHCAVKQPTSWQKPAENGCAKYFLWAEGTFTVPIGSPESVLFIEHAQ